MSQRSRIILGAVILALAALAGDIWWTNRTRPPDPVYSGQRLSWWVSGVWHNSNFEPPLLDSNAVPYLIHVLKARDSRLLKAYLHLYPHLPVRLQSRLQRPVTAGVRRFYGCLLLGSLGPAARPAIPELLLMLNPDDDRHAQADAIYVLSMAATRNDADVMAALQAAGGDNNPDVRTAALVALQKLDPGDHLVIPADTPQ